MYVDVVECRGSVWDMDTHDDMQWTDPTNGQARTRAWKRLRKLLGIAPGAERRAIVQAAADEIEGLGKKGQELKNLVEMIAGQRDAALAERNALQAEVDELCSKVCDECDGSGEYTLTDSTGYTELCPCVCVGETDSYQRLKAERDALDAEVARLREFTGGGA